MVSTNKLASDSNGGTSAHLQSKRSKNERTDVARESSHRVHIDQALLSFSRSLDKKCCVVCVVSGVGLGKGQEVSQQEEVRCYAFALGPSRCR